MAGLILVVDHMGLAATWPLFCPVLDLFSLAGTRKTREEKISSNVSKNNSSAFWRKISSKLHFVSKLTNVDVRTLVHVNFAR